jgi:hypothetical protein
MITPKTLRLELAFLVLSSQLRRFSGEPDKLWDWQETIWTSDQKTLLLFIRDNNDSPGAGVYMASGDTAQVSGNSRGYQEPLEFMWKTGAGEMYPMASLDTQMHGFKTVDVGNDQYLLVFTVKALKGVFLRVRRFDERWVAVMKHNGKPVVIQYGYAKVKYTMGVPRGVDYINLHGFGVTNCSIDYSKQVTVVLQPGANFRRTWELDTDEDPLCMCGSNPTCSENGEQPGGGGDEPELVDGKPCVEFMSQLFSAELENDYAYVKYVSELEMKNTGRHADAMASIAKQYGLSELRTASCLQLPLKVPQEIEAALSECLDSMVYAISISRGVLLKDYGHFLSSRIARKTDVDHVTKLLDAPRRQFLRCLTLSGKVAILHRKQAAMRKSIAAFSGGKRGGTSLDGLGLDDAEEDVVEMSYLVVGMNICLMVLLCLKSLGYDFSKCCRCCSWCKQPAKSECYFTEDSAFDPYGNENLWYSNESPSESNHLRIINSGSTVDRSKSMPSEGSEKDARADGRKDSGISIAQIVRVKALMRNKVRDWRSKQEAKQQRFQDEPVKYPNAFQDGGHADNAVHEPSHWRRGSAPLSGGPPASTRLPTKCVEMTPKQNGPSLVRSGSPHRGNNSRLAVDAFHLERKPSVHDQVADIESKSPGVSPRHETPVSMANQPLHFGVPGNRQQQFVVTERSQMVSSSSSGGRSAHHHTERSQMGSKQSYPSSTPSSAGSQRSPGSRGGVPHSNDSIAELQTVAVLPRSR